MADWSIRQDFHALLVSRTGKAVLIEKCDAAVATQASAFRPLRVLLCRVKPRAGVTCGVPTGRGSAQHDSGLGKCLRQRVPTWFLTHTKRVIKPEADNGYYYHSPVVEPRLAWGGTETQQLPLGESRSGLTHFARAQFHRTGGQS